MKVPVLKVLLIDGSFRNFCIAKARQIPMTLSVIPFISASVFGLLPALQVGSAWQRRIKQRLFSQAQQLSLYLVVLLFIVQMVLETGLFVHFLISCSFHIISVVLLSLCQFLLRFCIPPGGDLGDLMEFLQSFHWEIEDKQ